MVQHGQTPSSAQNDLKSEQQSLEVGGRSAASGVPRVITDQVPEELRHQHRWSDQEWRSTFIPRRQLTAHAESGVRCGPRKTLLLRVLYLPSCANLCPAATSAQFNSNWLHAGFFSCRLDLLMVPVRNLGEQTFWPVQFSLGKGPSSLELLNWYGSSLFIREVPSYLLTWIKN